MRRIVFLAIAVLFLASCAASKQRPIAIKGTAIVPEVSELEAMARTRQREKAEKKQDARPDEKTAQTAIQGYLKKALGHMDENPAASLMIYEKILSIEPGRWDAHYNSGIIYLRHKDFEKAEQEFFAALKNSGPQVMVYNALGQVYMLKGRDSTAADYLRQSIKAEKTKGALLNLAFINQRMNERDEAFRHFKLLEGMGVVEPELNYGMGVFLYRYGDFSEALKRFGMAYDAGKRDPGLLYAKAQTLLRLNDYEGALSAFKELTAIDPNDPRPFKNIGIIYEIYLEDMENAIANYQIAYGKSGAGNEELKAWIDVVGSRLELKEGAR
jgi:Flp pilus assembly protein TadD